MRWKDGARLAISNLRQTPLRTALTTMGVVIGIGTLVCMFAFGLGIQRLSTEQARRYNTLNTIQVLASGFPMGREARTRKGPPPPALDDAAVAAIRKVSGVGMVTPVVQFPMELKRGAKTATVLGRSFSTTGDSAASLFQLSLGAFFSSPRAYEMVVQEDLPASLGFPDARSALGQEITLAFYAPEVGSSQAPGPVFPTFSVQKKEIPLRVVGIIKKQEGLFGESLLRSDFLIPLETARELGLHRLVGLQGMFRNPGNFSTYTMLEVRAKTNREAPQAEERIGKMGFRTISFNSILKEMNQFFLVMDAILGAVGSISLVVAALGIVNTMIIAVLERRKEIGIMKAVGASRGDIKQLFFMEGSVIGAMGGLLGFLLGWSMARAINAGLNIYIRQQGGKPEILFAFPLWLIWAATGFALLVSLAAALYPAARAARLDPVEALRYE